MEQKAVMGQAMIAMEEEEGQGLLGAVKEWANAVQAAKRDPMGAMESCPTSQALLSGTQGKDLFSLDFVANNILKQMHFVLLLTSE